MTASGRAGGGSQSMQIPAIGRKRLRPVSSDVMLRIALLILAATVAGLDSESDQFWMAREGLDVLRTHRWIHQDAWGWAPVDGAFIPNSPLWQITLALVWQQAGGIGIYLLSAACSAIQFLLVARIARTLGADRLSILLTAIVSVVLVPPLFTARAGLPATTLFIAAVWWWQSIALRRETAVRVHHFARWLLLAFVIPLGGVWLHASWAAFGPAVALVSGLAVYQRCSYRSRLFAITAAAVIGLAAIVACCLGPLGADLWVRTLDVAAICRGLITEWLPAWELGEGWLVAWLVSAALAAAVAMQCVWSNAWRSSTLFVTASVITAAAGIAGAAVAVRSMLPGVAILSPLLAMSISQARARFARSDKWRALGERSAVSYWRPMAVPLLIVGALAGTAQLTNLNARIADPALQYLPPSCRLFSDPKTAAPVLLTQPEVLVWADGRADYWGRDRLREWVAFLEGRQSDIVPKGTSCIALSTSDPRSPLARRLATQSDWYRAAASELTEVWLPQQ